MAWSMGEHQKRCAHILDGAPLGVKVKSEKATKGEKKRRASEGECPWSLPLMHLLTTRL